MIISFAWTTQALLDGTKTVTRREWSDKHAAKFKVGDLVDAWDKSPRFKGKKVGVIRIVRIARSGLHLLTKYPDWGEAELKREGGRWDSVPDFCALFQKTLYPYRVVFDLVSVVQQVMVL